MRVSGWCSPQSGAGPGAAGGSGEPRSSRTGGRGVEERAGQVATGAERPIRAGKAAPEGSALYSLPHNIFTQL